MTLIELWNTRKSISKNWVQKSFIWVRRAKTTQS